MIFSSMAASRTSRTRRPHSDSTSPARSSFGRLGARAAAALRTASLVGLGLGLGLVASCGGGTSQQEPFLPERLLAFGDETSVLTSAGRRYGVNGLTTDGTFDCTLQPIWTMQVAVYFGFVFAECNPTGREVKAKQLAVVGARVADVATQVDAQVAAGGFRDKDLALLLVGANDILALYGQYPARSEDSLIADARSLGERTAQIVNRLVALGAKVVVSNVPDMGLSPFALAEKAAHPEFDRAALITRLSRAFNEQLGVKVLLDGRFIGLVQADLRFQAIGRSPGSFGLNDITTPVCTVALPDCTTATLLPNADPALYLWADTKRLAPGGQSQLGQLAVDRARRNPF